MEITFHNVLFQEDTIIIGETEAYKKMGIPFDEDHACYMDLTFMDGFAFDKTNPHYIMIYPTIEEVKADKKMAEEIVDYTGRKEIVPFDIALKYGEVVENDPHNRILARRTLTRFLN